MKVLTALLTGLALHAAHANPQELIQRLRPFADPQQNAAALSMQLRPSPADYAAVFKPEAAKKLENAYSGAWASGQLVLKPSAGQTDIRVHGATAEAIRTWTGAAAEGLPGGYRSIGDAFKDGVTVYRVEFVAPGKQDGTAYDALVFVNGNWRWFPKPARVLAR